MEMDVITWCSVWREGVGSHVWVGVGVHCDGVSG
jgi:hypothetical protein